MHRPLLLLLLAAALAAGGCGDGERESALPAQPDVPEGIALRSPAFRDGASIPPQHTCDGDGVSPPLTWTGAPAQAAELVLVVEDPDAPDGTFVHWTLFGLRPDSGGLHAGELPPGAGQGENSDGSDEWFAPCPPEDDDAHRYRVVLYALDARSGLEDGASPEEVREVLETRALAFGELTGRYRRTDRS